MHFEILRDYLNRYRKQNLEAKYNCVMAYGKAFSALLSCQGYCSLYIESLVSTACNFFRRLLSALLRIFNAKAAK